MSNFTCLDNSNNNSSEERERDPHLLLLGGDEDVEPRGEVVVVAEFLRLEHLDKELDRSAEVAADVQLLQRHHHIPVQISIR